MRRNSTAFIWGACGVFCASSGRTKYPTQRFWNAPAWEVCQPYLVRSAFAGSATSGEWALAVFLLYGELAEGSRLIGRPRLRYKDICKKDMKLSDINIDTWESRAKDRSAWHFVVRQGVQKAEETRIKNLATKRVKRKEKQLQPQLASSSSSFICRKCSRDCHSSIGLYSHSRRCR